MERRKFIQNAALTTSALAAGQLSFAANNAAGKKELYELREYEIHFGSSQNPLNDYLEKSLIPALNNTGLNRLVFLKK